MLRLGSLCVVVVTMDYYRCSDWLDLFHFWASYPSAGRITSKMVDEEDKR